MISAALGIVFIIIGAVLLRFPKLCNALKEHETAYWQNIGSPGGASFADMGRSAGLFSWVLNHGYEKSHPTVAELGQQALIKATLAKYSMLIGIFLLAVSFAFVLIHLPA